MPVVASITAVVRKRRRCATQTLCTDLQSVLHVYRRLACAFRFGTNSEKKNKISTVHGGSMQQRPSSPSLSRGKRKVPPGAWWFQREGYWDTDRLVWVPYTPVPQFFTFPGPLNVFMRPDARRWIDANTGDVRKDIVEYWQTTSWPHLTRSVRNVYVERRRRSLRMYRSTLWRVLAVVPGFSANEMAARFGEDVVRTGDEFRVDVYGNVVARRAQRYSPTAWDVDHIFPYSRGGLSVRGNLRVLHSRANQVVKGDRIETLIDPATMLVGIDVAQFLRMYSGARDKRALYKRLTSRTQRIESEISKHANLTVARRIGAQLRCDNCLVEGSASLVCSQCKQFQFCSLRCHQQEWLSEHGKHRGMCTPKT